MKGRQSESYGKIALERIRTLFLEAEKRFSKEPDLANRYVELARKIAMKCRIRIPAELRRRFCKNCHAYLKPGVNLRVRLQGSKVVYQCLKCKEYMRFPYIREKKSK